VRAQGPRTPPLSSALGTRASSVRRCLVPPPPPPPALSLSLSLSQSVSLSPAPPPLSQVCVCVHTDVGADGCVGYAEARAQMGVTRAEAAREPRSAPWPARVDRSIDHLGALEISQEEKGGEEEGRDGGGGESLVQDLKRQANSQEKSPQQRGGFQAPLPQTRDACMAQAGLLEPRENANGAFTETVPVTGASAPSLQASGHMPAIFRL